MSCFLTFFELELPFCPFLREIALQAASSAPLFSRPKRSVQPRQVYPYVFDALATTHQATAFISDTKVLWYVLHLHCFAIYLWSNVMYFVCNAGDFQLIRCDWPSQLHVPVHTNYQSCCEIRLIFHNCSSCVTAAVISIFIFMSFSAIHIYYDLSDIHLHLSSSMGISETHNVTSS